MIADAEIARAFETTWPAADRRRVGGFEVGRGLGGGGRVGSARSLSEDWAEADIAAVAAAQRAWGEAPLFRVASTQERLRRALADQGYAPRVPTLVMAADCAALAQRPLPPMSAFAIWPPLAMQRDIWSDGNIGPARQQVMARVAVPRTALLGRVNDRAAGAAFVAADGPVAMIHAIEVVPAQRRQGVAGWLLTRAALWALSQGASRLALAVARRNEAAQALYQGLGFRLLGEYDYWSPRPADG
ncbi:MULTISPECIES: GNAT family N-acetyltransferase [unclassified Paracoccus (in: a-proteobacteria)]|uniref:GNAT family N-acetyltransferase n=1 Tax=unclassified Paracoccus (in: a-proteobacteria) TaxID=2688777 RepID=UPI0021E1373A|nr:MULTISPECIES: GNAT family N-acetyltransferase [unclassified Paracoccus (in: a-proteobacteria)]UXU73769.1 GNAT family N-acetyltransferase [Paracoccus sp. SMMA_5]UXU79659.1 GNAT family N-acetyltransferase [Paracoccus sp. SMMA_5_TC]